MLLLHTRSRANIEAEPLPGPSAVICMADSQPQLAVIKDQANVLDRLNLIFNDAREPFHLVSPPTDEHGRQILDFVKLHISKNAPNIVFQCEVGVGRSHGAHAAIAKIFGGDPYPILSRATYNRKIYRGILAAAGLKPDPEPLVSIAVRVKYAPDRLQLFLLSMQRQRYENWEVIAVTDGPNPLAVQTVKSLADNRVRIIETEKPLGLWGHPYRQVGLDACRGEFIGMSNDDNYYVPGYLEQMINASKNADLILCRCLHNYFAWGLVAEGGDLGSWLARSSLIRKHPWFGTKFSSDEDYLNQLRSSAGPRIAKIERALFVHN